MKKINIKKIEVVYVRKLSKIINIKIDNFTLKKVEKYKYLGNRNSGSMKEETRSKIFAAYSLKQSFQVQLQRIKGFTKRFISQSLCSTVKTGSWTRIKKIQAIKEQNTQCRNKKNLPLYSQKAAVQKIK